MSRYLKSGTVKKGIAVWILGFLSFLAFINVFNSVLWWSQAGPDYVVEPYLISQFFGNIQIWQYFWLSIITALILFGGTIFAVLQNPEETGFGLLPILEAQKRVNEEYFEIFNTSLQSIKKEMANAYNKPEEILQELIVKMEPVLQMKTNIDELSSVLEKQEEILRSIVRLNKSIEKAKVDITNIKKGLTQLTLETMITLPKPKITAESSPKEIKGIGPRTIDKLKAIGITNVGEFLTADPTLIGEKTPLTKDKAEHLQGIIQQLLIPEIDETDISSSW